MAVWLSSMTRVVGESCQTGSVCSGPHQQDPTATGGSHSCGGTEYCCQPCPNGELPLIGFTRSGPGCAESCECASCPGVAAPPPSSIASAILSDVSSTEGSAPATGTVSVQEDLNLLVVTYSASEMPPNKNGTIQIHEGTSCDNLKENYLANPTSRIIKSGSASWTSDEHGHIGPALLTLDLAGSGIRSVSGIIGKAVTIEEDGPEAAGRAKICGILTSSTDDSSSGLEGWQIGLIVVCCCLALCVVALAVALVCVVKKRARHAEGQGVEDGVIIAEFEEDNPAKEMRGSEVALSDTDNALDRVRASQEIPAYTLPPAKIANPTMPAVKIAPPTPELGPTPRQSAEFGAQSMSPNSSHDVSSYDDQPSTLDRFSGDGGGSIKM